MPGLRRPTRRPSALLPPSWGRLLPDGLRWATPSSGARWSAATASLARLSLGLLASVAALPAGAADAGGAAGRGIYSCVTAQGRRLTSDRPIPECSGREQLLHNRDGSLRRVLPPTLTPDERAAAEAAARKQALARAAQADAVRRDRNLMNRYPDQAAHDRARGAALEPVQAAIRAGEVRLKQLQTERKTLQDEAEFYLGRTLPARLRQQLDSNDAAVEAQRASAAAHEAEIARVNRLYDRELARLRRLWAGAAPGSSGATTPDAADGVAAEPARAPADLAGKP